jgi:drug/metabolite transporter (DMT)-like permease
MQTFVLSSIAFVIVGQLLNACIVLIDKYIVTNTSVSDPKVYAFYVAIISGVVLILVPFGVVNLPTFNTLTLSLIIGFTFIASIVSLYSALKHANATDVVAWLAAVSTLTTFVFGFFFLNEQLPASFAISLILFLIGMALVGHFRFYARSFLLVVCSGILFGLSAVLIKVLFAQTNFIDGFFWSRMGNVVGALSLLLFPSVRKTFFSVSKSVSNSTSSLIVVNRILGGVAFLCVLYAIRLGSVSVVNALSSLQFVFIFLLIFLLRNKLPEFYQHEFRPGHVFHKILAILFIMAGFFTLFI